jgi:hypothetical protein
VIFRPHDDKKNRQPSCLFGLDTRNKMPKYKSSAWSSLVKFDDDNSMKVSGKFNKLQLKFNKLLKGRILHIGRREYSNR